MARAPWNWLGFLVRYGLAFALVLALWSYVRLAYGRMVVTGSNAVFELLEADPETHVVLHSLDQYRVKRGDLLVTAESTSAKMIVDTLVPFLPLVVAIPRLTWRNRLILLLVGLGTLYLIQVGLLLVHSRYAIGAAYLSPALDGNRHLVPFRYSPASVRFYEEAVSQFWVGVGYYWAGPIVGLGLGAWLLSRQERGFQDINGSLR